QAEGDDAEARGAEAAGEEQDRREPHEARDRLACGEGREAPEEDAPPGDLLERRCRSLRLGRDLRHAAGWTERSADELDIHEAVDRLAFLEVLLLGIHGPDVVA